MKSKRKMLELSLEYEDLKEAIRCVEKMLSQLKSSRTNYGRELKNGCLIQWGVTTAEIEPFRVETINGVLSMVIPSKMNEKK